MRTVSGQRSRTSFKNSTPDKPGMRWSQRITLNSCRSRRRRASSALPAVTMTKSSSSVRRMASSERTSSSTTKTADKSEACSASCMWGSLGTSADGGHAQLPFKLVLDISRFGAIARHSTNRRCACHQSGCSSARSGGGLLSRRQFAPHSHLRDARALRPAPQRHIQPGK